MWLPGRGSRKRQVAARGDRRIDLPTEYAQARRHGSRIDHGSPLLERDAELAILTERLRATRRGEGGVVFVEAPAGRGSSQLLRAAGGIAQEAGMRVLEARGDELERDFPFGLAVQLFEPELRDADLETRGHLLGGPAHVVSDVLAGLAVDVASLPWERGYALIHGLFWLTRNLTVAPGGDGGAYPVALLVDDVHWGDQPSLRFLAYLAQRAAGLPVALIVAARTGEASAEARALSVLRTSASECVLRPAALSAHGVATLGRAVFPDAEGSFVEACLRATSGNPFLVVELLKEARRVGVRPDEQAADRLAELKPRAVLDRVVSRLAAMAPEASALAGAVAVLGEDAPLQRAAFVADLDVDTAVQAADALAAIHLLHPGTPLRFIHPLIRAAVRAALPDLRRGELHRRAAAVLTRDGEPEEAIARHLLASPPMGDARMVEVLRVAARAASSAGAPARAARMLERALAEGPERAVHGEVLAELAGAELAAGLPQALGRLEEAIETTDEQARRAELALTHGRALIGSRRYEEAARVLALALGELDEQDVRLVHELDAVYVAAATYVPGLRNRARARGDAILERAGNQPSPAQRVAIAHLAMQSSQRNAERGRVLDLAELAWSGGALLDANAPDGIVWPLLAGSLLFVDELERSLEICDAAEREGKDRAPANSAAASYCRAWSLYHAGRISDGLAAADASVAAGSEGWYGSGLSAYAARAACLLQLGELDQAEHTLSILEQPAAVEEIELPVLLDVRAQLRLAQLRPAEALSDAVEAGRRCLLGHGDVGPGVLAWRSTAALAHLALGEHEAAGRLARDELERARHSGVTRVVIRDLRVLGLVEQGTRRLELLDEAVQEGSGYRPRLEQVHALVELGGALRRANQRAAAREPLRRGLELAHRAGSRLLADQARRDLAATGARPRRAMLSGPDALTPSERRVAELAAEGLTTRQISEALYVSPKTVEFHLRHIYRKLDVSSSRTELARALAPERLDHPSNQP